MTTRDEDYRDLAEMQRLTGNAETDIEGIERDAAARGWEDIEVAASNAASALRELAEQLEEALR